MWGSQVDGRKLTFHLAGINNQNFIMRDEETGSWWQQVSGEAIHGPLKGKRLEAIFNDEISFAVLKREHPQARVLKPDARVQAKYEAANWEEEYEKLPVVTQAKPGDKFAPRTLMGGVTINGASKAYPLADLVKQRLIVDSLGGRSFFLIIGDDNKSVRAFDSTLDGRQLEFLLQANTSPLAIVDAETATTWDFSGKAVTGTLAGKQLTPIPVLKDYWFDWQIYHPDTAVYTLGERLP